MPCRSDWETPNTYELDRARERIEWLEAALCALMNKRADDLGGDPEDVYAGIDYNEAGITKKELKKWWEEHQVKDAERRLREEQERQAKLEKQRLARERKKILAMLTPEQREILGVK